LEFVTNFTDHVFLELGLMTRIWAVVVVALAVFLTGQSALAEKRIALVIGNGTYPNLGALKNPPQDAKLMARTLRSLGFEVIERIDANQKGMKKAIKAFGNKLEATGKDAVGLFYYTGHGVQVRGENFLVPVNVDIQDEADVDIEAVSANAVLDNMAFAGNDLNIVILDACRNNPFKRGFRSASRGLARMDASRGTLIAYATSPGDVAADGSGTNSPYTAALATAMRKPDLLVEQMFKQVRVSVQHRTKDAQTPWESSSLTGNFYFVPGSKGSAGGLAAMPLDLNNTQEEIAYWQSIQDSRNSKDFQSYLERYGETGAFTILARNRVKTLRAHESDGTSPARRTAANGKSDQQLATEALIRGRKMILELASNANHVMGIEGMSLTKRVEKFRGLLGEVVDFKPMAQFVLGGYYDTATPDEWAHFYATYKELFLSGYEFTAGENWTGKYEIEKIRAYGKDMLISIRLDREDGLEAVKVGFRVRRRPNSFFGYKIIDALTKGISLLVTQRDDFRTHLKKGGLPYLTDTLEKRFGKAVRPVDIPG
jgi:ABC-type transporter MlaC component